MTKSSLLASGLTNGALIAPNQTVFVVVDHQVAFASCFEATKVKAAEYAIDTLVVAARNTNIPVIVSLLKTNSITSNLSVKLEKSMSHLSKFTRNCINPWDNTEFVETIQQVGRSRILIAGISSETSMTFTALCALERGFEVYIVRDACLGHSEQSISISFERLLQAGAVPVSWRQVVMEWCKGSIESDFLHKTLGKTE